MRSPGPRAAVVLGALALAFVLALAAALTWPSLARTASPPAAASDPGYTVVPWANQSVRVLDARTVWLPPLLGFTGPGLLLADDPYAAAPASVAATSSPAPNGGIALYDYGTGSTRNLTFPWSIAGAFSPTDVTPFTRDGRTYLLSLAQGGNGITGSVVYEGEDLQVVAAGLLDYPAFSAYTAVNLSIPLTSLGFARNTTLGLSFAVTPDGANLSAVVEVGVYTGDHWTWNVGPPWAKYVYAADLAQASWADGEPVVLTPRWTVPWSSPVTAGYTILLGSSQLLVQTAPGGSGPNLMFYDLDHNTWTNTTIPGRWPVWYGRLGGDLYLLEDNWQISSYDDYALDRVDLDAQGVATGATEAWDKTFPRYTNDYFAAPVVTGDRLDVFLGKNGWEGGPSPTLTTISSYDLVCGDLLSETNVSMTLPLLNGQLMSLAYPSLHDVALFNGFVAELTHGILEPLDLPAVRDAAAAARNETACTSCTYAVYVTQDAFPHLDLLLEEQYTPDVFGSSTVTNLTAIQLTADAPLPPPLPAPRGDCPALTGVPGGGTLTTVDLATIAAFLLAGTVLIVVSVVVLSGRRPGRRV